jgi:acyl carrier protein
MMIGKTEILSTIKKIITRKALTALPVQVLTNNEPLDMDSVARLTLLVELENEYQVELLDDHFDSVVFESIETLSDFVERKIKS